MTMTGCPDLNASIHMMRDEAHHVRCLNRQIPQADPIKDYGSAGARRFQRGDIAANLRTRGEKLKLNADSEVASRALLFVTRVVNDLFRQRRKQPVLREVQGQVRLARKAARQELEDALADLAQATHARIAAERKLVRSTPLRPTWRPADDR